MGWSIDSKEDGALAVDALDTASSIRRPEPSGIVYADHWTQFSSWIFGNRIRSAGARR